MERTASPEDLAVMTRQLGRPVRNVLGVGARCACGAPTVVMTRPRLEDGTPFPTFYYLTHPAATAAVSRLEADGRMAELGQLLAEDETVAEAYAQAHHSYLDDREQHGVVPEIEGVSAGGMPTRVKCLHALAAHSLARGSGVNPIGDIVLAECGWSPEICQCDIG